LGAGLLGGGCSSSSEKSAARIAIVIGPAGTSSAKLRPVYDWAIDAVNRAGGAGGRKLEAKYVEMTSALDAAAQAALAAELLADPEMVAVAGLFSFALAPKLVAAKVPYITPETEDDDVFRAFHEGGYVWRTVESDATMLWFMLAEAKGRGEKSGQAHTTVGLLTSKDAYGSTFFDWYGFHATELGLQALAPVQYDQDKETCEPYVDALLAQGLPDFLIAVPSGPDPFAQAACMVRTMKARGATSTVLLADSAYDPALIAALGSDAEGLAGYNAAPDPNAGFGEAFTQYTHLPLPPAHAANVVDAIALLAYGLEKSGGEGRQALDTGMRAVVDGQGPKTGWQDFAQALSLIRAGQSPDISGASGPLRFDHEVYTDPTATYFDRWVVTNGSFQISRHVTTETESSPNVTSQTAVSRGLKNLAGGSLTAGVGSSDLPPLGENWALVVATSGTWENYRHQADALAHYQALKNNGFDDQHIVLVTVDDLAGAAANPTQGKVVNQANGPNVRSGAASDYTGKSLTSGQLMAVLEGKEDSALPAVLHSRETDNVYLFMVGHGGVEGPYVGMDERSASMIDQDHYLSPNQLASTVARMKTNKKFRRMLIAVDACHSGVLAPALEALAIPDVVLFTAAASAESSFSTNYVSDLDAWVADQFSFNLLANVRSPDLAVSDLYARLYHDVAGSHVQVANQARFGDATAIRLSEFVTHTAP